MNITDKADNQKGDLKETGGEGPERVVLAAADTGAYDVDASLEELCALCETAGAVVLAEVVQRREKPDRAGYLGAGKLAEAQELCERLGADTLVVDDERTGSTQKNMENAVGVDVVDRTTLILDIFAQAAKTAEGKLQVELAQLNYRLPRLAGAGTALSRIGGSASGGAGGRIGTRGPGETKRESYRRYIRARISLLKDRLAEVEKRRAVTRVRRQKAGVPVVALVGYTNVGKSSLLNSLTGADVLAENKLFATLDPTVRSLAVGELQQIVLVDTVGFVSRLPHNRVDAVKSTLEEARYADLILEVLDASSAAWPEQQQVTRDVLAGIGAADIPRITVFNKCDLVDTAAALPGLPVSAATGAGLDALLAQVSKLLAERVVRCTLKLPFDQLSLLSFLRARGNVLSEEYAADGVLVTATVERAAFAKVEQYVTGV
ncbi:MAG: GTPase HflX [Oscillospiraceae bacterium]|nr:GTPase HflX [Oscillospiraceae bacterium]